MISKTRRAVSLSADGYTCKEIASRIGSTPGSVKVLLFRARERYGLKLRMRRGRLPNAEMWKRRADQVLPLRDAGWKIEAIAAHLKICSGTVWIVLQRAGRTKKIYANMKTSAIQGAVFHEDERERRAYGKNADRLLQALAKAA